MRATSGRCLVSSACLLLINGCVVGPNYEVPQSALVNSSAARQPFVASADPALSDSPTPQSWWHLYDDSQLDQWVEEAL